MPGQLSLLPTSTLQFDAILAQNPVQAVPPLFLQSFGADDAIGIILGSSDRLRERTRTHLRGRPQRPSPNADVVAVLALIGRLWRGSSVTPLSNCACGFSRTQRSEERRVGEGERSR